MSKDKLGRGSGDDLADWWRSMAEVEISKTVPKTIEYGGSVEGAAMDLIDIGRVLAEAMGMNQGITDQGRIELGIFFYMVGKMSRWKAAILAGKMVSDDTLFDIGVYNKMAQRNRVVGGWPNGGAEK